MKVLLYESKADIEKFVNKFGQEAYDRFQAVKQRIPSVKNIDGTSTSNDIVWHTKYTSPKELEDILTRAENREYTVGVQQKKDIEDKLIPPPKGTTKLVYNKNGIQVYFVHDWEDMLYIASDKYGGKIGRWCIAGRYPQDKLTYQEVTRGQLKVSQAKSYFYSSNYWPHTDEGYYVIITPEEKYCVLYSEAQGVNSVWNMADSNVGKKAIPNEVKYLFNLKDWSKEIFIWNGKKRIPEEVVYVEVEEGVEEIPSSIFTGLTQLQTIKLPNSIETLEPNAFGGCINLTQINLPDGLFEIHNGAFRKCKSLTSINIPSSVNVLTNFVFDECTHLKTLSLPGSIGDVSYNLCSECSELETVTLGEGITGIQASAFNGCYHLKSINIPSTVVDVDEEAFPENGHNLTITVSPDCVCYNELKEICETNNFNMVTR